MALTDIEIQNIVFNETRSLSGPSIAQARENISNAIINGDNHPPRPISAPTTVGDIPAAEQNTYDSCGVAVANARQDQAAGHDPTQGAIHFNFRPNNSTAPFQGHALKTQCGPLNNSHPTDDLPANGVYSNTYK
jgi:hypothetical protein